MKLLLLIILFPFAIAQADYSAQQVNNLLYVSTPEGQKIYVGDHSFLRSRNYELEIPILVEQMKEAKKTKHDEDTLVMYAKRLYKEGRFKRSLHFVNTLLEQNQRHKRAWLMKGSLMQVMGQKKLARKAWRQAQHLDPDNEEIALLLEMVK